MGMNSAELNLDLSLINTPKTISELIKEVSVIDDVSEKSSKLNNYLHILEDELRKIHAFKRELPISTILLNDAIKKLKEETMPIMEEFIPLKGSSDENGGLKTSADISEMKNWMSSAQLWSASNVKCENYIPDINNNDSELRGDKTEDGSATKNPVQPCNFKNRGGAYVPFKGPSGVETKGSEVGLSIQGQSASNRVGVEMSLIDLNFDQMKPQTKLNQNQHQELQEQHKKQRRCWSPELHRTFVDALQQLGGAQTATPKHIRELMHVEGLTNDEVKSHLQKYRIHVRKLPDSSASTSSGA